MSSDEGWTKIAGPAGSHAGRWIAVLVVSVMILSAIGAYALSNNSGVVRAAATTVTSTVTDYSTVTQYDTTTVTTTATILGGTTTIRPLPVDVYVAFTNITNPMDYSIKWGSYTLSSAVSQNTNVSLFNVYKGEDIYISMWAGASSLYCTGYGSAYMSLMMNSTVAAENSGQIGYCTSLSINYTV
jgi:hypothetical protein